MNQRFLLGAFLVIFSATAKAQINKGMWTIGGTAGYSSSVVDGTERKSRSFDINPSIGFVIKENTVVGFTLGYGNSKSEEGAITYSKGNSFFGGVFYSRYLPISSRFYGIVNSSLSYSNSENESTNSPNPLIAKANAINFRINPGFSFALSRKVFLESYLSNFLFASYSNQESSYQPKSTNFTAGINANPFSELSIGIRVFLGGAKPSTTTE